MSCTAEQHACMLQTIPCVNKALIMVVWHKPTFNMLMCTCAPEPICSVVSLGRKVATMLWRAATAVMASRVSSRSSAACAAIASHTSRGTLAGSCIRTPMILHTPVLGAPAVKGDHTHKCLGRQGSLRPHALSAASYLQTTSNCPNAPSACICSTVMPRPFIALPMASMTAAHASMHVLRSMQDSDICHHSNAGHA